MDQHLDVRRLLILDISGKMTKSFFSTSIYLRALPTLPHVQPPTTRRPTKFDQHDGGNRLRTWRMVNLLPQDDDQSIADDLSYQPIIVPWQEMGVKAVGMAAERG